MIQKKKHEKEPKKPKQSNKPYISKFLYPDVLHINSDSFFIYDQSHALLHFMKLSNKNLMKVHDKDLDILKSEINKINSIKYMNQKNSIVEIPLQYAKQLETFKKVNVENKSNIIQFLIDTINSNKSREAISYRKLSKLYESKIGKKIRKNSIHYILRKQLNYRFLKTNYKTRKIESYNNKIHCFFYIKAFIRCLKLNFNFIFVDESKIELTNNHLRCWRKKEENIFFGNTSKQKLNLLLAIGKSNIIYYKITQENTNTNTFLEFLNF